MSRCPICGEDTRVAGTNLAVSCICGFCQKCLNRYGHDGCYKILEERKKPNEEK